MKEKVQTVAIETPDHFELHFQLAGIGSRFLAYLLDKLIQFGVFFGLLFVILLAALVAGKAGALTVWLGEVAHTLVGWAVAGAILVYGVIAIGYFIVFEYLWSGSTPGKRSQGIRVIRKDGRPITFLDSAIRNVLRFVDIFADVYPIGLVVMFIDSRNRRLGDLTAGTLVIMDHELRQPSVEEPGEDPRVWETQIRQAMHEMTPEDYHLLTTYLSRREALEPKYREELAKEICNRLFKDSARSGASLSDLESALEILASL
ncbi:MAG: RDD family protein, partial [Deltaproteobacteria bacterium]